jgi:transcriptional regulator with XRE-family HTH domain
MIIKTATQVRELLSANIKTGRQRLGLTQEKLAELAELSTQTISDIEGCRTWVSETTLLKLAEVLKVDIFQLLMPLLNEKNEHEKLYLPQRISKLRQSMKEDIDKRLDRFFACENDL